jgi:hypothetical protein
MLGSRALIVQSELEEEFVELGFPLDALNAQEQIALHAVIQRAIDGRKCWTWSGQEGIDVEHSWLDCRSTLHSWITHLRHGAL